VHNRGRGDTRPPSVSFPLEVAIDTRQLSLSVMSRRGMPQSSSTTTMKMVTMPNARCPQSVPAGECRPEVHVRRLGKDAYVFSFPKYLQRGGPSTAASDIELSDGQVRDTDTVLRVGEILQECQPQRLPTLRFLGDAVRPGTEPTRRVRARIFFHGNQLVDDEPIGRQCLSKAFFKYF
jgi:hypothetical protein